MFSTIEWTDDGVVMLDQRRLPEQEIYLTLRTPEEVAAAIRDMAIRGAPAIGVAAAMGLALGAKHFAVSGGAERERRFGELCALLAATRPTAVNLFWAIERMKRAAASVEDRPPREFAASLLEEARRIKDEDIEACRAIGRNGAPLVPDGALVLTHCNAGALATAGYGTALGVLRAAKESGKTVRVLA